VTKVANGVRPAGDETRDTSVFDAIPSETTREDRAALLLLRERARAEEGYVYLEIGSYLGGTLQPFYADPHCSRIYSIDARPDFVPDARGRQFYHYDRQVNATATMLANLAKAFPAVDARMLRTFDSDASAVDRSLIDPPPHLCFIDAEHTNEAVFRDFCFCLEVSRPDAIIGFHDAGIVFEGIRRIKRHLADAGIRFRGFKLGGSVYAILLGDAVDRHAAAIEPHAIDEAGYFGASEHTLAAQRAAYGRLGTGTVKRALTRVPVLFKAARAVKRFVSRPRKGSI